MPILDHAPQPAARHVAAALGNLRKLGSDRPLSQRGVVANLPIELT